MIIITGVSPVWLVGCVTLPLSVFMETQTPLQVTLLSLIRVPQCWKPQAGVIYRVQGDQCHPEDVVQHCHQQEVIPEAFPLCLLRP